MIHGRRICAIVPARGGSKGIPRKNLYRIGGVTLLERAIRLATACGKIDRVYVSTDDVEMHAIASAYGCNTPALRPESLSNDAARTIDVVKHLVQQELVYMDDCILLLQPSSPLRTLADLSAVCGLLESQWSAADAVISVCEIRGMHPYKAQVMRDGYLRSLLDQDAAVPRQSLPVTYIPNGAYYFGKTEAFFSADTFMPPRSIPFIMSDLESINLDNPMDIVLLEALIEKGMVTVDNEILSSQS